RTELKPPALASLQLNYNFDESAGGSTPALDTGLAPAANGIFTNQATRTASTPSGNGFALDLSDASNDWVSTPAPAKINGLTDLTLTAWIDLRGNPSTDDRLVDMI